MIKVNLNQLIPSEEGEKQQEEAKDDPERDGNEEEDALYNRSKT